MARVVCALDAWLKKQSYLGIQIWLLIRRTMQGKYLDLSFLIEKLE